MASHLGPGSTIKLSWLASEPWGFVCLNRPCTRVTVIVPALQAPYVDSRIVSMLAPTCGGSAETREGGKRMGDKQAYYSQPLKTTRLALVVDLIGSGANYKMQPVRSLSSLEGV